MRQATAVGGAQLEVELQSGDQHEPATQQLRVGQRHAGVAQLDVSEQQNVDVDRPRAMAPGAGSPSQLALQALDRVEYLQRRQLGLDAQARVQEARLVEHLPDRIGVV